MVEGAKVLTFECLRTKFGSADGEITYRHIYLPISCVTQLFPTVIWAATVSCVELLKIIFSIVVTALKRPMRNATLKYKEEKNLKEIASPESYTTLEEGTTRCI